MRALHWFGWLAGKCSSTSIYCAHRGVLGARTVPLVAHIDAERSREHNMNNYQTLVARSRPAPAGQR
jgi:hypothetical protein